MSVVSLIVLIFVIGFLVWAAERLFGKYIDPEYLKLGKNVAFVCVVLLVIYTILGFLGIDILQIVHRHM